MEWPSRTDQRTSSSGQQELLQSRGMKPHMQTQASDGLPESVLRQAILIAAIWGFNFLAIKAGVAGIPPLALASIRFTLSVFPAILFVKRPDAPMSRIAAYGILLGVGEFGFLFTAIALGAPSGVSSIILQAQAFFTAFFSSLFLRERIRKTTILGMAIASIGLMLFGLRAAGVPGFAASRAASATSAAFKAVGSGLTLPLLAMLIAAAASWAGANVVARTMPKAGGLGLVVWSSLFSPIPLALLSVTIEGPQAIAASFTNLNAVTVLAVAYIVILSTHVGYGLWNRLIMQHGAARIAPFSLMVPVFALVASTLVLGEQFGLVEAAASFFVMAGLVVHVTGGRRG